MKGLVLSGGKGTRLRPLTFTGAKQLVPIANKPVLFYVLEDLVEAGITDIGIIVGDTHEQVRAAVGDGATFGARVTYIQQDAPLGLAHAVRIARDFLQDDPFVMFLGDNLIRDGIVSYVRDFEAGGMNSLIVLKEVPNPREFGIAVLEQGRVTRLMEKPKDPPTNLAVIGIYIFDSTVFEAVESITPSARGELEITDALQYLIDHGFRVEARHLTSYWTDTGKMDDMLEANRWVLEQLETAVHGAVDAQSALHGRVQVEPGAVVINSTVRGPAIIGRNTVIENCYIGPFTSISHDCVVRNSEVEHCIIMDSCAIDAGGQRIESSLIGRNVQIQPIDHKPRAYKLVLGDHSRIGLL
ncbi:MAG: glucose-1-phosphate thymidylyltransferase [Dehalococcoidia bacterium]|nr:glucose-1-phosphate thymidylyltransferase [Dehalococcoidia bacterium]